MALRVSAALSSARVSLLCPLTGRRGFKSRSLRPREDPTRSPPSPSSTDISESLERVRELLGWYVIGSGEHGQLGLRDVDVALTPKKLDALDEQTALVTSVTVGHNHSVALLSDGRALAWGYNASGQCGLGHRDRVDTPSALLGLEGHAVQQVALGPLQSWLISLNLKTGKQAVWHIGAPYADERPDARDRFTAATAVARKVQRRDYLGAVKVTVVH